MTEKPHFPPLFEGLALTGLVDPFERAQAQAIIGCNAGLVAYNIAADRLRAAIVFAPEVPLHEAMPILIACGIGFQNALGALAPPEVAVHLGWPGEIYLNGAECGKLRIAAASNDDNTTPDWIIVGLDVPLIPANPDMPGFNPNQTCLYEEGCIEVAPEDLLSAWMRHTLVWINRMEDDGMKPLNAEWRGLAKNLGENVVWSLQNVEEKGLFVGTDEVFGALLRQGEDTKLVPMSRLLEQGE
ncbi:biotin/lipoate--protein ligase family protein [Pseudopelagicola sp. nBUS_19]|uniref:biotin/lipoate--protein ligase family protein n=1 Tax=unclassified Pseudopelagicola TaxID=2649563 RepID=UPI003EBC7E4B